MSRHDSPTPDPHRFTLTDYTSARDDTPAPEPPTLARPLPAVVLELAHRERNTSGSSRQSSKSSGRDMSPATESHNLSMPLPAVVSSLAHQKRAVGEGSSSTRQSSKGSQGSVGSTKIRPLPTIPKDPLSLSLSSTSAIAAPSSSQYVASPITMTSTSGPSSATFAGQSTGTGESSASYYPRPYAPRTISDRKGKQAENSLGIQTRPGRNGSGGSSHHRLQLHEVGRPIIASIHLALRLTDLAWSITKYTSTGDIHTSSITFSVTASFTTRAFRFPSINRD